MAATTIPFLCLVNLFSPDCEYRAAVDGGMAVMEPTAAQKDTRQTLRSIGYGIVDDWGNAIGVHFGVALLSQGKEHSRISLQSQIALERSSWSHEASGDNFPDTAGLGSLELEEELSVWDLTPSVGADVSLIGRFGVQLSAGFSLPLFGSYHYASHQSTDVDIGMPLDLEKDATVVWSVLHGESDDIVPLDADLWVQAGFGFGLFAEPLTARVWFRQGLVGRRGADASTQTLAGQILWTLKLGST